MQLGHKQKFNCTSKYSQENVTKQSNRNLHCKFYVFTKKFRFNISRLCNNITVVTLKIGQKFKKTKI